MRSACSEILTTTLLYIILVENAKLGLYILLSEPGKIGGHLCRQRYQSYIIIMITGNCLT